MMIGPLARVGGARPVLGEARRSFSSAFGPMPWRPATSRSRTSASCSKRRIAGGGERTPGRRRERVEGDRGGFGTLPVMTGAIGEIHRSARGITHAAFCSAAGKWYPEQLPKTPASHGKRTFRLDRQTAAACPSRPQPRSRATTLESLSAYVFAVARSGTPRRIPTPLWRVAARRRLVTGAQREKHAAHDHRVRRQGGGNPAV